MKSLPRGNNPALPPSLQKKQPAGISKDNLAQQKEQYAKEMSQKLDEFKQKMVELKKKGESSSADAKAKANSEFEKESANIKTDLERLKEASNETWNTIKIETDKAFARLQKAYDDALAALK